MRFSLNFVFLWTSLTFRFIFISHPSQLYLSTLPEKLDFPPFFSHASPFSLNFIKYFLFSKILISFFLKFFNTLFPQILNSFFAQILNSFSSNFLFNSIKIFISNIFNFQINSVSRSRWSRLSSVSSWTFCVSCGICASSCLKLVS